MFLLRKMEQQSVPRKRSLWKAMQEHQQRATLLARCAARQADAVGQVQCEGFNTGRGQVGGQAGGHGQAFRELRMTLQAKKTLVFVQRRGLVGWDLGTCNG